MRKNFNLYIKILTVVIILVVSPQLLLSKAKAFVDLKNNHSKQSALKNNKETKKSEVIKLPDDNRFINKSVSESFISHIISLEICKIYQLRRNCSYRQRYIFKDAILIVRQQSTAGASKTLEFQQPIPVHRAIDYAKILVNLSNAMNQLLSNPYRANENEIKYGVNHGLNTYSNGSDIDDRHNYDVQLDLIKNEKGKIKKIHYGFSTP